MAGMLKIQLMTDDKVHLFDENGRLTSVVT
jgi:hypothetical protein